MSPMFNNLDIGLKGYDILQVNQDKELVLDVELKPAFEPTHCPYCCCSRIRSKGKYLRKARHLEAFRRESKLRIHTRRFQCCNCLRSFLPEFPGVIKGRHSSEPFRQEVFEHHHHGMCSSKGATKSDWAQPQ